MTSRRAPRDESAAAPTAEPSPRRWRRRRAEETPAPAPQPERPGAKGRPTRSRREALEARRRPLVPADRKEARQRSRTQASTERQRAQQAMMTGDEANMPPQHRGADRRLVRDIVDARHNLAEYFLIVALVLVVVTFALPLLNPNLAATASTILLVVMWGGIIACVIDALVLRKRLRRELTARFGQVSRGLVGYGVMRAIQFRRWRLPKPQVKHGEDVLGARS